MALDSETAALLARLEEMGAGRTRDMGTVDAPTARAASRAMWTAFIGEDASPCRAEPLAIPGPAGPIPAWLYRPRAVEPGAALLPIVVFLHGGGWALGDLESYDPLVKVLCEASGVLYLSVDYRLAPEHKFPAGLEDGLAAVRWAAAHAAQIGGDRERIAVMGDSAGANLATVIAHRLRDDERARLAAQFLLYPVLDVASPHASFPSRLRFGDGTYLLTRRDIEVTTAWYLDGRTPPDDPAVSPLLAETFADLPPTLILTAGHDPLQDEARVYADRLRAAGVPTEFRCFETTIHAFLSFGVLDVARKGRAWLAERVSHHLAGSRRDRRTD